MGLAIKVYGVSFGDNNIGRVTEALPIESITLSSDIYVYNSKNTAVCEAAITPNNTPDKHVIWSITEGASYASIDQTGKLTVLSGADGNSVTVKAVSRINPEVFATVTMRVKYANNLATTGIYGYYKGKFLTKPATGHTAIADTTLREVDETISTNPYIKLKSSVSDVLKGYIYGTCYDRNMKALGNIDAGAQLITSANGVNINVSAYKNEIKYISISFDLYGTSSSSPLMVSLKNVYGNVAFTQIKNTDTTISFTNFITID